MRASFCVLFLVAIAAAQRSDMDERLDVDKLDRASPLDDSGALTSVTPALREQIRRENAAAQRAWEQANPDLVREHEENLRNTKPTLDTSSLAEQLQQVSGDGLVCACARLLGVVSLVFFFLMLIFFSSVAS